MADRPQIAIGDLIFVGSGIRAVVAWVRDRGAPLGDGVAVYLDDAKNAIDDNVKWTGTQWAFVREPPSGHDANEVPALRPLWVPKTHNHEKPADERTRQTCESGRGGDGPGIDGLHVGHCPAYLGDTLEPRTDDRFIECPQGLKYQSEEAQPRGGVILDRVKRL